MVVPIQACQTASATAPPAQSLSRVFWFLVERAACGPNAGQFEPQALPPTRGGALQVLAVDPCAHEALAALLLPHAQLFVREGPQAMPPLALKACTALQVRLVSGAGVWAERKPQAVAVHVPGERVHLAAGWCCGPGFAGSPLLLGCFAGNGHSLSVGARVPSGHDGSKHSKSSAVGGQECPKPQTLIQRRAVFW